MLRASTKPLARSTAERSIGRGDGSRAQPAPPRGLVAETAQPVRVIGPAAARRCRQAMSWPRTARSCWPGTPTRGPTRCSVLRAARAAAEHDLPLVAVHARATGDRGAAAARAVAGGRARRIRHAARHRHAGVPVLEALDQAGLLARLIPEWDAVRFRTQHNPVHRFTVDRHLLETAAQAAALTRQVAAAGSAAGRRAAARHRQGLPAGRPLGGRRGASPRGSPADGAVATATRRPWSRSVRHHLLLPDTATRRDLDDPVTIETVAEAVGGLGRTARPAARADHRRRRATGPLVVERVEGRPDPNWSAAPGRCCRGAAAGGPRSTTGAGQLAEAGALAVEIDGDEVIVAAPDALGVLSRAAGVLALHSLDVRSASISTHAGMAVNAFVVEPRFGRLPDPSSCATTWPARWPARCRLAERSRRRNARTGRAPASAHPPPV